VKKIHFVDVWNEIEDQQSRLRSANRDSGAPILNSAAAQKGENGVWNE
jgi:hypothetical protein